MIKEILNPGSKEAIKVGCTCPVMDNNYGHGAYSLNGQSMFWYDLECPLHKAEAKFDETELYEGNNID